MATTGKDGITHYGWSDIHTMADRIKWPDRTSWATVEIRALPRNRERPRGALEITGHAYIEAKGSSVAVHGRHVVVVPMQRRVYLADAVEQALRGAKDQAALLWKAKRIDQLG